MTPPPSWKRRLGFGFIGLAVVGWTIAVVIPFLPQSLAFKGIGFTVAVIIAEVSFLVGIFLLGREYKDKIHGWMTGIFK